MSEVEGQTSQHILYSNDFLMNIFNDYFTKIENTKNIVIFQNNTTQNIKMSQTPEEYLLHGTQDENLIRILKKNAIQAKPPKKYITMLVIKPSNQIFTQLIYKDIPNQGTQKPFWGSSVIVLSKQLLKDYPFYATGVGGFKTNFEEAFKEDNEIHEDNKIIIKSPLGNLSRMPNLTKLKNKINQFCEKGKSFFGNINFMHSHEILFNRDIPLDKYCVAIIEGAYEHSPELEKICNDRGIPFMQLEKPDKKDIHKQIGLNNFIDLIDKIKK